MREDPRATFSLTLRNTVFSWGLVSHSHAGQKTETVSDFMCRGGMLMIRFRMRPWLRRLITRATAIVPAVAVILATGADLYDPTGEYGYGELANVSSYAYSGASCDVGNTGVATFDPGGPESLFFVIVGNDGTVEGSFGLDGSGTERPEDVSATAVCDRAQDLNGTCG